MTYTDGHLIIFISLMSLALLSLLYAEYAKRAFPFTLVARGFREVMISKAKKGDFILICPWEEEDPVGAYIRTALDDAGRAIKIFLRTKPGFRFRGELMMFKDSLENDLASIIVEGVLIEKMRKSPKDLKEVVDGVVEMDRRLRTYKDEEAIRKELSVFVSIADTLLREADRLRCMYRGKN